MLPHCQPARGRARPPPMSEPPEAIAESMLDSEPSAALDGRRAPPLFDPPPLFRLIGERLLPALLDRRRNDGRRLRIWSAACGSGAEPYSIAVLLRRHLLELSDWQVSILGSDGEPHWFPHPRHPLFDEAALAAVPAALRSPCFRRAVGTHCTLIAPVRRLVEFSQIDLQVDAVPALLHNTHALDLILCRGLLPRLPETAAARVIEKLLRALLPGGWLLVDRLPASPLPATVEVEPLDGLWLLQRQATPAQAEDAPFPEPGVDPDAVHALALTDYRHGRFEAARRRLQPAARSAPRPARLLALLARIEAVQGRLEDARAWSELSLAADELDPASHCLRACILHGQAAYGEAMQAFQRALYLDPGFMLAHYGLGMLARRLGRFGEAERHFANAAALARNCPPDAALPNADGLTAGRLLQIIVAMQGEDG